MVSENKKVNEKKAISQIFTPDYIAEFMVKNIKNFIVNSDKIEGQLSVLEPSVGEGVFLKHLLSNGFTDITAFEMDLSLKNILIEAYPKVKFRFKNFLGSNITEKYDIIIGNPPYLGQNYYSQIFQDYCKKYEICKKYFAGNMDLFYYFIHLGIHKLKPGGLLAFITTNYWITKSKKTGIKLLKPHILDETFILQYIDLSQLNVFSNALGQHNCIFLLQKKTNQEKVNKINKPIEIIQVKMKEGQHQSDQAFNKTIFDNIISEILISQIKRYTSAMTNNDLQKDGSWNLLYPQEFKAIVNYIEQFCAVNDKITFLKDLFVIRNGIIFPKDDFFILTEKKNLKKENNGFSILIDGHYHRLNPNEISRLKKVYKSKSISSYSYNERDFIGYGIFLNKNEFIDSNRIHRNEQYEIKYPNLTSYLNQFQKELREILINAKENPEDLYFPRRGAFIKKNNLNGEELIDLEPYYDTHPKIFLKYITTENQFGFSNTSYYATSDTYFLWQKNLEIGIDYPFLLAYLNSKLLSFLFVAKNISIKRSKTKLEDNIPIPNLNYFRSEKDLILLSLIRILAKRLMNYEDNEFDVSFYKLHSFSNLGLDEKLLQIQDSIKNNDSHQMKQLIDDFIFELFELDKKDLENILKEYY